MARKRDNILMARFSALGDIAMTLPEVYDACLASPERNFYFLTRQHPSKMFADAPSNLTVVGVDLDRYKGLRGMWRLARELRDEYGIDTFLDLHDVLRTRMLGIALRMKGVRIFRLDKGRRAKKALTRRKAKEQVQLRRMTDRYRDVFAKAGLPLADRFRSLFGDDKGAPEDFAKVSGPKQGGEKWLAVAPFAKHPGKIYPMHLMKKVIDHFAVKPGWKIFVFGFGDNEIRDIDALTGTRKNVVNMARAGIGIRAELALLSHCDVMLSMDSANMHLASLVGLRTVSVWGATHPYAGFMGWNQDMHDAVQLDMVCRPCSVFGNKPCARGDYHCLNGIPPSLIIEKIEGAGDIE